MALVDAKRILATVDVLQVVGAHVQLRRSGAVYWGRCPFHTEKTQSFQVRPAKSDWHCFGCGIHGDVITFVRKVRDCTFREACEYLSPGCTLTDEPLKSTRWDDVIMDDPVLRDVAFGKTKQAYEEYRRTWPWSALPKEKG